MRIIVLLSFTTIISATSPIQSVAAMSKSPSSIKLTYFNIEGVAEAIRLALILSGTDFEDDLVGFADWAALKPKTPQGQLPIMQFEKDGKVYTQSGALLRHVGNKYSTTLYPSDKMLEIEEVIGVVGDMQRSWMAPLYVAMKPTQYGYPEGYGKTEEGSKKVKELREAWMATEFPKYCSFLEAMLDSHGGKFLVAGDQPTIADCFAVPALRNYVRGHVDHVPTTCLDSHPKLVKYIKDFCSLDEIKGRYTDGIHE